MFIVFHEIFRLAVLINFVLIKKKVIKSNYQEKKTIRKFGTVEVVLVLEITPCPLTNVNRDSTDNLQDKVLNHVQKYELLTAYL